MNFVDKKFTLRWEGLDGIVIITRLNIKQKTSTVGIYSLKETVGLRQQASEAHCHLSTQS